MPETSDVTTVIAQHGQFEEHPESFDPRIFVTLNDGSHYECLRDGFIISWPALPTFPYAHFKIQDWSCFEFVKERFV